MTIVNNQNELVYSADKTNSFIYYVKNFCAW